MITVITGASGVGKTTLVKELLKDAPNNLKGFHFDDIGIPDLSKVEDIEKWKKETTKSWIKTLLRIVKEENLNLLFEGSIDPKFCIQEFRNNKYEEFEIILLDCTDSIMKKRLYERGQPHLYNQDMRNWLKNLREVAIDQNIEIIRTDIHSKKEVAQKVLAKFPI